MRLAAISLPIEKLARWVGAGCILRVPSGSIFGTFVPDFSHNLHSQD
jgi:hypothetical protein